MNLHFTGLIGLLLINISNVLGSTNCEDEYWGPDDQPCSTDESIRPFKIVFDKQMIDDLKMRLNNTRKPQPSIKNDWTYGTNSDFMPTVVDYWLNKYDFEKREARLNQYPQFLTNIQGLDIHFLHVKPQLPKDRKIEVVPLYIQHGWPGSVVEFYRIIPMLTTAQPNRDFVFELIIPTLPGFGYSSATTKPGLGAFQMATVMKNLMLRLGFTKWYTQGGDWGGVITSNMATIYPQHVLGMHSNWCLEINPISYLKEMLHELPFYLLHWHRLWSLFKFFIWLFQFSGYFIMQATKPDTLGVGLSDSPAGLASYILEKFAISSRTETFGFGNETTLLDTFTMDELLDNLMLYWAPNKVTSSFRIYAETIAHALVFTNINQYAPVNVPSACAQFPFEVVNLSEKFLRHRFVNMVSFTKLSRGGHFAALEEPQLLANDVWAAVKKMRKH